MDLPFWAKVKADLLVAFLAGVLPQQTDFASLTVVDAGRLSVPSGWIVADEPYLMKPAAPLAPQVAPGHYPVRLVVFEYPSGDRRVGLAQIVFSEAAVEHWSFASTAEEPLETLSDGELVGYGVDGGMGAFIDQANLPALMAIGEADDEFSEITRRAYENYQATFAWTDFPLGPDGQNMIVFTAGVGDGFYWTYIGWDVEGRPVTFVTDFGLEQFADKQD